MLKDVPVVLENYKLRVTEAPEPKTFKNKKTGQVELVVDRQNNDAQLFVMAVTMKQKAAEGRRRQPGFEVRITLETDPTGEVEEDDLVELHNPRISQHEIEGRQIVSIKATGAKPVSH